MLIRQSDGLWLNSLHVFKLAIQPKIGPYIQSIVEEGEGGEGGMGFLKRMTIMDIKVFYNQSFCINEDATIKTKWKFKWSILKQEISTSLWKRDEHAMIANIRLL